MVKRQFWTAFSLTLAVYLLGIAAAVWVIEPPEAPAAEPVREAVEYSPDPEEDLILLGVMEGEEPVVLLRLVDREQGLIVAPGNPLGIRDIADLAREGVRFINRQKGSGTRVLLDYRLKLLGISPGAIQGYPDEEYTHMNVAAAVLSGRADAGLAVRAAANALGLPFEPVGVEEYDLVIPRRFYETEAMRALLDVIRGPEFRAIVEGLGGYGTEKTGQVIWEYPGR